MTYLAPAAELMFFDGQPLAHVVAREDHLIAERRRRQAVAFIRDRRRTAR